MGELNAIAWTVCQRTVTLLSKRGLWLDANTSDDLLAREQPLLGPSLRPHWGGTLLFGERPGQRPMRLFAAATNANGQKVKSGYGFDVDASVRLSKVGLIRQPISDLLVSNVTDITVFGSGPADLSQRLKPGLGDVSVWAVQDLVDPGWVQPDPSGDVADRMTGTMRGYDRPGSFNMGSFEPERGSPEPRFHAATSVDLVLASLSQSLFNK